MADLACRYCGAWPQDAEAICPELSASGLSCTNYGGGVAYLTGKPLNQDSLTAAMREHGLERVVICGDMQTWLIANRIVGLGQSVSPAELGMAGTDAVMVVAPSDMVKLDDSLGAGVWGLR